MARGICYGRSDLGVAASFEEELVRVQAGLPRFDRIVSSPLRRCQVLAARLAEAHGMGVTTREDITEMDFGAWEMQPWDGIPRDDLDLWAADFMGARPHGGECVQMLRDRVARALDTLVPGTLVVTHSGVIRAAAAITGHEAGWDIKISFGGWVQISR